MFQLIFTLLSLVYLPQIVFCEENVNRKWFPYAPKQFDTNPEIDFSNVPKELHDSVHGIQMGVLSDKCDNGKINLTIDWNESPLDYTCYGERYEPKPFLAPVESHDLIPTDYHALHYCMSTPLYYKEAVPTFGYHRPLWAKYGEYMYVPKQRWIHNLEHGAVVMLYHPCADMNEVKVLRHLVTNCLYRHIITPYAGLSIDRPLALVTWGTRLLMSKVNQNVVLQYIKNNALNGPEINHKNGQFDKLLLKHAEIVSDLLDSNICSNFINTMK